MDEIPQITPMRLDEIAHLIQEQKDDMKGWQIVNNRFRIIRKNGEFRWAFIPATRISIAEIYLFRNPRTLKNHTVAVDILEAENLNLFFAAAIAAGETDIMIVDDGNGKKEGNVENGKV